MDQLVRLYLERGSNELKLAGVIFRISDEPTLQTSTFGVVAETYYSAVISHAYYAIFYTAKAYLLTKGIKTSAPEEHKRTFEAFSALVDQGVIDVDLLKLYELLLIRADALLQIFELEKGKRGRFTYKRLPQANRAPAHESISHAQLFLRHMHELCQ
jgi:uncharacterized protein (UPF0332 family)